MLELKGYLSKVSSWQNPKQTRGETGMAQTKFGTKKKALRLKKKKIPRI